MKRLIVWLGLLMASAIPTPSQQGGQPPKRFDPRLARLTEFFTQAGSPIHYLAEDFLVAADIYRLDWRLLPSISMVESSAGKRYANNNVFGWNCARSRFRSVREGIYLVASRLAHSKLYKDKELNAILATYNKRAEWALLVKSVMRTVDPTEPLKARETVEARVSPVAGPRNTDHPEPAP